MERALEVKIAKEKDIESWMDLVKMVRDNFPGLETEEALKGYRETLVKNIARDTAICVTSEENVVGVLLYSYSSKCLSCMAVHPDYRRKGIASLLVEKMIDSFPACSEISVSTFREGDPLGVAPRALYKNLGFVEGDLTIEFGHPTQIFKLSKS